MLSPQSWRACSLRNHFQEKAASFVSLPDHDLHGELANVAFTRCGKTIATYPSKSFISI